MYNLNHWNKFYKTFNIRRETSFARFVLKKINKKKSMLEVGCGNGRDTFFFRKNNIDITAVDSSSIAIKKNKLKNNSSFKLLDFCKKKILKKKFHYIYARFLLHAINEQQEQNFFKNCIKSSKPKSLVFLEFRTTQDDLIKKGKHISKNERIFGHYRRFIDINEFKRKVKKIGFKLIYFRKSKNFAKFNREKPNICRVIMQNYYNKKNKQFIMRLN